MPVTLGQPANPRHPPLAGLPPPPNLGNVSAARPTSPTQVVSVMKKKILIIEDQAPMRRNIALLLELASYEVCTADNGRTGIEAARQQRPDLILCDVMMPELDGHGVVFQKLGVEGRNAATLRALEVLSNPAAG